MAAKQPPLPGTPCRHAALLAAVPAARRLAMEDLPSEERLADMVRA